MFLIVAGYQVYLGISRDSSTTRRPARWTGRCEARSPWLGVVGLCARGVAFALIGIFIVRAAIDYKPSEAVGLDGALYRLTSHSYGPALLLVVAPRADRVRHLLVADARFRKI